MSKGRLLQSNKGISMIELIVVILIISILVTGATASIVTVTNARVQNAISTLESVLSNARVKAQESADKIVSLNLKKDADDKLIAIIRVTDAGGAVVEESTEILGNEGVELLVYKTRYNDSAPDKNNQTPVSISDTEEAVLHFNNYGGLEPETDDTGKYYCTDFLLSGIGNRTGTVIIIPATGRVYVE